MLFKNKETHPSYGMLQFSRTTGGKTSLFGSSIKHKDTIRLKVKGWRNIYHADAN